MAGDDTRERPTLRAVDEWAGGCSWIANPDEERQKASHALLTDAGVWIVEPVDAAGVDERVAELGDVAGVLVIYDRHMRDAVDVAHRHDVPVYAPEWMSLVFEKSDAAVESVSGRLPGTNYAIHRLRDTDEWQEAVLVDETTNTMIVPEAVGTRPSVLKNDHALGVHYRLDEPPERLLDWHPDRILVGHGTGIHEGADAKLREALDAE